MLLSRLWRRLFKRDGDPPAMRLFWQANRHREAGRFEEAAALVARGLRLDPDNVVGLLLSGSLHTVFREMQLAKADFERVLTLDAVHPRALLGLARIAMEEGQPGPCTDYLRRALARYPEFPEAQALLDVVAHGDVAEAARPGQGERLRLDGLRMPAESREALLARVDGTLLFAEPRGTRTDTLAARTAQLARVASAMMSRCQLAPVRHAIIEGPGETTVLKMDVDVVLSMSFDQTVAIDAALAQADGAWVQAHQERSVEVA